MKIALERLGFTTTLGTDLRLPAMNEKVDSFLKRIGPGDVAVFYYSGHGMQLDDENLLVPVDFSETGEAEAKRACVRFNEIQNRIERSPAALSILVMDACRNNPFRTTRSFGRGLATVEAGMGTYVAFAASPGQTADDNPGERNGLFTKFLLKSLQRPPALSQIFRGVRDSVWQASGRRQRPYLQDQLIGDFEFEAKAAVLEQPPSIRTATGLLDYGMRCFRNGQYPEALRDFELATKSDPENAFAQNAAGMAYARMNQHSLALERFSMAILLKPDLAAAYLNRGLTYLAAGRYQLAAEDFTWAAEQEPTVSIHYVHRGMAYFGLRIYEEARADYDRAIGFNSSDGMAYFGRAQVHERLGQYREAIADYDAALERKPEFKEARDRREALARRQQR
jgi:Tfp pilus assembly protein PilF